MFLLLLFYQHIFIRRLCFFFPVLRMNISLTYSDLFYFYSNPCDSFVLPYGRLFVPIRIAADLLISSPLFRNRVSESCDLYNKIMYLNPALTSLYKIITRQLLCKRALPLDSKCSLTLKVPMMLGFDYGYIRYYAHT